MSMGGTVRTGVLVAGRRVATPLVELGKLQATMIIKLIKNEMAHV